MKSSLENRIYLRCPTIFRNRDAGVQSSLMSFGIACNDGWYQLIYDLSSAIEDIALELKKQGVSESTLPEVSQIKEKFGGLRFYVHNLYGDMDELISAAEEQSMKTCEMCGKPGTRRAKDWVQTLCDECEN